MTIIITSFTKDNVDQAENDLSSLHKGIIIAIERGTCLDFRIVVNEEIIFLIYENVTFFTIQDKRLFFTTSEGNSYEAYVNYNKIAFTIEKK